MVGIIARCEGYTVFASAHTREEAEDMIVELLEEEGVEIVGKTVPLVIFDPLEVGGFVLEGTGDMEGWGPDGYNGD